MGKPDFIEERVKKKVEEWKSGVKTEKLPFFPGISEEIVPIFALRIEAPLLHVLDPNSPIFYVKCPRKC